jgi:hypothetical protein
MVDLKVCEGFVDMKLKLRLSESCCMIEGAIVGGGADGGVFKQLPSGANETGWHDIHSIVSRSSYSLLAN